MTWRARIIGVLCTTLGLAAAANAQDIDRQIRFFAAGVRGDDKWQGYIQRLTADSLYLRVRGTDTPAAFSRTLVRSVERERLVQSRRAAGVGCLTVGTALGALGFFGVRDPDAPGLHEVVGVLGFGLGCAIGAAGALMVSAAHARGWESWTLPDSMPSGRAR